MRKALLACVVLLVVVWGGCALRRALASDDTKIRWLVEDMVDGFNRTRMNPILGGLAPDFLDETAGADRALVQGAVARLFFTAKDPETKRFLYRAEADVPAIEFTGGEEERQATTELSLRFFERRGEEESLSWEIRVPARFALTEDGWRLWRTEYVTKSGQRLR